VGYAVRDDQRGDHNLPGWRVWGPEDKLSRTASPHPTTNIPNRSVGFVKRSGQFIAHHHQQNTLHSISNRYHHKDRGTYRRAQVGFAVRDDRRGDHNLPRCRVWGPEDKLSRTASPHPTTNIPNRSVGFVKRSQQFITHHHQQNTLHSISNRYHREKTAERTGPRRWVSRSEMIDVAITTYRDGGSGGPRIN